MSFHSIAKSMNIKRRIDQGEQAHSLEEKTLKERLKNLRGRKALVVDDNDMNLEVALGILSRLGLNCVTAKDGGEAARMAGEQYF